MLGGNTENTNLYKEDIELRVP